MDPAKTLREIASKVEAGERIGGEEGPEQEAPAGGEETAEDQVPDASPGEPDDPQPEEDAATARIPIVSNVTGDFYADRVEPTYWADHVRQAVLFHAGMEKIVEAGAVHTIEEPAGQGAQPRGVQVGEVHERGALQRRRRGEVEVVADEHRRNTHDQRDAGAKDDATEDVAAKVVRAGIVRAAGELHAGPLRRRPDDTPYAARLRPSADRGRA